MTVPEQQRPIAHRTLGFRQGPITRLMSPGDLGRTLKPFVFLDLFTMPDSSFVAAMGLHPHSGIATVTVLTRGDLSFDDDAGNRGTIAYGGAEWMRAGLGVWHGRELGPGASQGFQGFQLWLALPPELELSAPDSQYLEAHDIPTIGPARLIVGEYDGQTSPVRSPPGINYLLVTLEPGASWRYVPPPGHDIAWLSVAQGEVTLDGPVSAGEMAVLAPGNAAIDMRSSHHDAAIFVLGTAVPHPHPLHLGSHSVHTSRATLAAGERQIADLRKRLLNPGLDPNATVPVLR